MSSRASGRPHVLTLTDSVGDAGAERIAVDLATEADPSRFRRSLCVTRGSLANPAYGAAENVARLRRAGVDIVTLDRTSRWDLWPWTRLLAYIRRHRVDVVHAHKFGSNFWGAVLGHLGRVAVVVAHEHTWSFEGQRMRRLVDRQVIARLADVVVAVSEADRRRMIEVVGIPAGRIVLIPNGIPPLPSADGSGVRQELGLALDSPVIVMTAVLRAQKAIDVMLEALAFLRRSVPDVRLLVAGPGNPEPFRAMAARLSVEDAVTFLGHRGDIAEILAAGDVGVLSSDFEGSPLAVLEYMAAGLPVVATDVGGVPVLVRHGETGLLVPRRDPGALAGAIDSLLSDRSMARSMGRRGQARQRAEYSTEIMSERVYRLYDELLACQRRGRVARASAPEQSA